MKRYMENPALDENNIFSKGYKLGNMADKCRKCISRHISIHFQIFYPSGNIYHVRPVLDPETNAVRSIKYLLVQCHCYACSANQKCTPFTMCMLNSINAHNYLFIFSSNV